MNSLAGRVEVTRQSYNYSRGTSQQNTSWFEANNTSNSSINTQIVERQLVDANLVRQLTGNLALAFLNVEGESSDDVLVMQPLFPADEQGIKQQLGIQ